MRGPCAALLFGVAQVLHQDPRSIILVASTDNCRVLFPPTLEAAQARVRSIRPADYARTRNHLDGAVSQLSPYITHGMISLPQVLVGVASRHPLPVQHKLVQELGWREYFHHVWQHRGDGILDSFHAGPLPESVYHPDMPADIREARTGVPVIDRAVEVLYDTGYLHNHARMWLASYVVHMRKIHWRAGADWMFAHLLDGDLASNHLSWQWIAGTASSKPYLFNAENVARFAPPEWHSAGSVLDTTYEALDAIARTPGAAMNEQTGDDAASEVIRRTHVFEPPLLPDPPQRAAAPLHSVHRREVWLVHPWNLNKPPASIASECVLIGWWPAEFHARWPWNPARWRFVDAAMSQLTSQQCVGDTALLQHALAGARAVHTYDNPHVRSLLPQSIQRIAAPRLFPEVAHLCQSFSSWWKHATRGIAQLTDLPGVAAAHLHPFR
ncbi:MAG: deoxyribodipyrimidine photolyase [Gemmatimonadaceae bacterium]|nr:deoxyribodipyrimidine photolyase [Gemmatimonadaceae bacterium]